MARILVVDDEKSIRITLQAFLLEADYEVGVAEDAEEALGMLAAQDFDVVLSDIIMPRITGVRLLQSITETAPHVQVILMTGEPTVGTASEAVRAGAFDYLSKPIKKETVLKAVSNAARVKLLDDERRRLIEENRRYQEDLERLVEERTAALRKSEEQFRDLYDNAPAAYLAVGRDGHIRRANQHTTHLLGYALDDVIGRPIFDLYADTPDGKEKARQVFQRFLAGGLTRDEELQMRHADGRLIWISLTVDPVRDAEGAILETRSIVIDITERKRAEEALRESERRYRGLFENAPISIWEEDFSDVKAYLDRLTDVEDIESYLKQHTEIVAECSRLVKVIDINQATLALHEARDKSVLLGGLEQTFTETSFKAFAKEMVAMWKGETLLEQEAEVKTLDGVRRDVMMRWLVPPGYEETYARVLVTLIDITERKQAEEARRQSEERFKALFQGIPVATYVFQRKDDDFVLVDYNIAGEIITQGKIKALIGTLMSEIYDDEPDLKVDVERCYAERTVLKREMLYRFRTVGDLRDVVITFAYVPPNLVMVHSEDVTVRKQAEIDLKESEERYRELYEEVEAARQRLERLSRQLVESQEQERRRVALELHDEIGQLLTAIKLSLDTADLSAPRSAQAKIESAKELTTVVVSKVRDLSLRLRPAMLDDLGLLPTLLWHVKQYTAQTEILVDFEHAGLTQRRFASEVETTAYRIIQEALTNVARHAGVERVSVHVQTRDDTLHLKVGDVGAGFDPEAVLSAYETGGLSGLRERAGLVGGEATIASAPGKGTTIRAILPLGVAQRP